MLAVEDAVDGLKWAAGIGGLPALIRRSRDNLAAVEAWVEHQPAVGFLAREARYRSSTSICLRIVAPWFVALPAEDQAAAAKKVVSLLDAEKVAFDVGAYRDAPPGLRLWAGATVEKADLEALFPWLDWALAEVEKQFKKS
jgi:phosphoserine aminotransferase